jgi:hypothetical protein
MEASLFSDVGARELTRRISMYKTFYLRLFTCCFVLDPWMLGVGM